MLNEQETQLVLEGSMRDGIRFWEHQGLDRREAFIKALEEIVAMTSDPNSPYGEQLDVVTKKNFIHYRNIDLGI